jgi:hypothetical protein
MVFAMRSLACPSPYGLCARSMVLYASGSSRSRIAFGDDTFLPGPHQSGGAGENGFGPFGPIAHHQHRLPERRRFFLDPPESVKTIVDCMNIATNGTYSKGSVRHHGCAIRFFLIVKGKCVGEVWRDSQTDDRGIMPECSAYGRHLGFLIDTKSDWIRASQLKQLPV